MKILVIFDQPGRRCRVWCMLGAYLASGESPWRWCPLPTICNKVNSAEDLGDALICSSFLSSMRMTLSPNTQGKGEEVWRLTSKLEPLLQSRPWRRCLPGVEIWGKQQHRPGCLVLLVLVTNFTLSQPCLPPQRGADWHQQSVNLEMITVCVFENFRQITDH